MATLPSKPSSSTCLARPPPARRSVTQPSRQAKSWTAPAFVIRGTDSCQVPPDPLWLSWTAFGPGSLLAHPHRTDQSNVQQSARLSDPPSFERRSGSALDPDQPAAPNIRSSYGAARCFVARGSWATVRCVPRLAGTAGRPQHGCVSCQCYEPGSGRKSRSANPAARCHSRGPSSALGWSGSSRFAVTWGRP